MLVRNFYCCKLESSCGSESDIMLSVQHSYPSRRKDGKFILTTINGIKEHVAKIQIRSVHQASMSALSSYPFNLMARLNYFWRKSYLPTIVSLEILFISI